MFCPNCGKEMRESAEFCSNCGYAKQSAKNSILNKINKKYLAIVGVIIIFIIIGIIINVSSNKDKSDSNYQISNNDIVLKNGWSGDYFYKDGQMVRNNWAQYNNVWYYLGGDGRYIRNEWKKINGDYYYLCFELYCQFLHTYHQSQHNIHLV